MPRRHAFCICCLAALARWLEWLTNKQIAFKRKAPTFGAFFVEDTARLGKEGRGLLFAIGSSCLFARLARTVRMGFTLYQEKLLCFLAFTAAAHDLYKQNYSPVASAHIATELGKVAH